MLGGELSGMGILMAIALNFSETLAKTFDGKECQFQLLRREKRIAPRYGHLWQGWPARFHAAFEPIIETHHFEAYDDGAGEYWEEGDYPATVGLRFLGWKALLHPITDVYEDVPVGDKVTATAVVNGSAISFGEVHLPPPPPGHYERVQMLSLEGELLAVIDLGPSFDMRKGETTAIYPRITFS